MSLLKRALLASILKHKPPKAMVIFGPRRVGKTTLLQQADVSLSATWYTGDSLTDIQALNIPSTDDLRNVLLQGKALVIDEAQRVPDIGLLLKRLVDINATLENPVMIFATGSSSFELASGVKESALGRIKALQMWPLSTKELADNSSWGKVAQNIRWHMVYGMYPEICMDPECAKENLMDHCSAMLFKDIFSLGGIRLGDKFEKLVQYLAYNVGSLISYDSVSREIGLNKNTVADYITLLEQCFIVKVCPSYAKNLSNELKKSKKIYFCDNGIRNAVIGDFSPISNRSDAGALWENFVFTERLKLHTLNNDFARIYFWRTSDRRPRELDFIEVVDGKMTAIECKMSKEEVAKPGDAFVAAYPECPIHTISPVDVMNLWTI